jgi:hypothetical protein
VAKDLVKHFEERLEAMDGKAMIVCMSRRICVDLCNEIVKLRPTWHSENDEAGVLKIVMTGSATDGPEWQQHIRDKRRREALGKRFKTAQDPFKVVIVRDMWLTGFDVPSLHTMYADKPMRGHGLMQAIARVNRVFKDKIDGFNLKLLAIARAVARYAWRVWLKACRREEKTAMNANASQSCFAACAASYLPPETGFSCRTSSMIAGPIVTKMIDGRTNITSGGTKGSRSQLTDHGLRHRYESHRQHRRGNHHRRHGSCRHSFGRR